MDTLKAMWADLSAKGKAIVCVCLILLVAFMLWLGMDLSWLRRMFVSSAQAQANCESLGATGDDGSRWWITICDATPTDRETPISVTSTPTSPGTATNTPTPTPVVTFPPSEPGASMWIGKGELMSLPMSGAGWQQIISAGSNVGTPDLSNQDSDVNSAAMAAGLAFARTGDERFRTEVVDAIRSIVSNQSENGGRTLALGRELAAYIVAAELIELPQHDFVLDQQFRRRLAELRNKTLDGRTLVSTHEDRPNNWGTMAGASRAAIAAYLGDKAELDRTFAVFCGWAGERNRYSAFKWGDMSWQADTSAPVGINALGATKAGHSIDGALPEEMRRAGGFKWPPGVTGYAWGGLAGAAMTAEILSNKGYPAWECADRAMLRAAQFIYSIGWMPSGDDVGVPPLINAAYGVSLAYSGAAPTKNYCCTSWTHGRGVAVALPAQDATLPAPLTGEQRAVVAESAGDLADEVATLQGFGWVTVGEPTETVDADGNVLYVQVMSN